MSVREHYGPSVWCHYILWARLSNHLGGLNELEHGGNKMAALTLQYVLCMFA